MGPLQSNSDPGTCTAVYAVTKTRRKSRFKPRPSLVDTIVVDQPEFPRQIDPHVGLFDRFATRSAHFVGRAPFFAACVALVVLWAPSYFLFRSLEVWQLLINTATTIVTFLLVALLQNTEGRADAATQHKLNAIAKALADLMEEVGMDEDQAELEAAVGLEKRETSN